MGGSLFYWLFNKLSSHPIPGNLSTVRLMTRRYVDALLQYRERELFLGGVLAIAGFQQEAVPIDKHQRLASSYTFLRRAGLLVEAITSFSSRPLHFVFYLGVVILFLCLGSAVSLALAWLFIKPFEIGWPSLIISIWAIGGITTFSIGVVGIYVSKTYVEVKQRPGVIVRHYYSRPVHQRDAAFAGESHGL
jgi:putative glycosyltransferase